jgi:glycosyltransferase involved in cell wall biosynthesis
MRIRVTPLAAEPIPGRATPLSQYENVDYLLFNGNVFPHKNLRRLIDTFVLLKAKHSALKLVIAGKISAQGEMLKAETAHRNIEDVDWLGYVPDDQMKWLWQNARVYVYPGLSEGFGLPGLESMLVGTPVASSNATCLPEVYGDAAEYFDPYDVDDMARAIEHLLTDDQRRKELIKLGKAKVKEYSWRRFAEQMLVIYEDVGRE